MDAYLNMGHSTYIGITPVNYKCNSTAKIVENNRPWKRLNFETPHEKIAKIYFIIKLHLYLKSGLFVLAISSIWYFEYTSFNYL